MKSHLLLNTFHGYIRKSFFLIVLLIAYRFQALDYSTSFNNSTKHIVFEYNFIDLINSKNKISDTGSYSFKNNLINIPCTKKASILNVSIGKKVMFLKNFEIHDVFFALNYNDKIFSKKENSSYQKKESKNLRKIFSSNKKELINIRKFSPLILNKDSMCNLNNQQHEEYTTLNENKIFNLQIKGKLTEKKAKDYNNSFQTIIFDHNNKDCLIQQFQHFIQDSNSYFSFNLDDIKMLEEISNRKSAIIICKSFCTIDDINKVNQSRSNFNISFLSFDKGAAKLNISQPLCRIFISNIEKFENELKKKACIALLKTKNEHELEIMLNQVLSKRILNETISANEDDIVSILLFCGILLIVLIIFGGLFTLGFIIMRRQKKLEEDEIKKKEQIEKEFVINRIMKNFAKVRKSECNKFLTEFCPICLEELIDIEGEITSNSSLESPCLHYFHFKCIFEWISIHHKNSKCPMCNYHFINEINHNEKNIDQIVNIPLQIPAENTYNNKQKKINFKYLRGQKSISETKDRMLTNEPIKDNEENLKALEDFKYREEHSMPPKQKELLILSRDKITKLIAENSSNTPTTKKLLWNSNHIQSK